MGLISRVSSRTYRFTMQIFLVNEATTAVDVQADTTIAELTKEYEGYNIFYAGQQLDDLDETIEGYGITAEATIQLVLPVLGGGRKRKKKVYTTPKKIKHKRKNVKLATLKYYKVTDTGKLERKRKECTSCGPGIFMSNHKDRQYCGRCGLTIVFDQAQ